MFIEKNIGFGNVFYSDLIPELEHYFTTRNTGINSDEIKSEWEKYLGISSENFIHPVQTHSSNVEFVFDGKVEYPATDGLILTNFKKVVYLRFADCTPVIIYDKKANIGAIVHAGWRGTVLKIAPETVRRMLDYSKSDLSDIYAVIGPAIGVCCYKVGDEVVAGISRTVKDTSCLILNKTDGVYVNLKETNAQQLFEFGVPRENIDVSPYCTSCRNDLFYSYRKENGTDLRHNAIIKLKK